MRVLTGWLVLVCATGKIVGGRKANTWLKKIFRPAASYCDETRHREIGELPFSWRFVTRQGPCGKEAHGRERPVPCPGGFHAELCLDFVISVVVVLVRVGGVIHTIRHTNRTLKACPFPRMFTPV